MKKVIVQHYTVEQQALYDLSSPFIKGYAERLGFDYLFNNVRRCPSRSIYWEKIAYLREILPSIDEGSLVVWEDADSINLKDESFEDALPTGGILGMTQLRAGLDFQELRPWYNAGIIVMINCKEVRDFFNRVWIRPNDTDEAAIVAELKNKGWIVGDGIPISSIDHRWNCWPNNEHICAGDIVVKSWHGIPMGSKLPAMQAFIQSLPHQ